MAAEFGRRVREHREAQGLSQIELGELSDLHFTFISSIERGKRNPTLTSIVRLAHGLQLDAAELVTGLTP